MQVRFDDGRGRYFDAIGALFPKGARIHIRAAAEREGISVAAFLRRAVEDRAAKALGLHDPHRLGIS